MTPGLFCVYLLAGLTPFHDVLIRLWPVLKPWDDLLLLGLAVSLLPWLRKPRPGDPSLPGFWRPVLAFGGVCLFSALLNPILMSQAIHGARQMLPYTVAGLAAARYCRRSDVVPLLRLMCSVAAAGAVYGIVSFASLRRLGVPFRYPPWPEDPWSLFILYPYYCGGYPVPPGWRLTSVFLNDNYFGLWMAMIAPILLVLSLEEPDRPRRWKQWGTAALMMAALAWCYSRGAFLALAVSITCLARRIGARAFWLLLPVAAAVPLFVTAVDVHRFTPAKIPVTMGGRGDSLLLAWEVVLHQPLLGLGPGTRGLADMNLAKIVYETGLLGLLTWCWALFEAMKPGWQVRGARSGQIAGAILAALAAVTAASVGGEVWEVPQVACAFWILAGVLHVVRAEPEGKPVTGS